MMPSSLQNIHQHQMWERPIGKGTGLISCDNVVRTSFSETYHHKGLEKKSDVPHQEAPPISPERSTRQWTCVFIGALLYAPLTVRMYAYSHTIAMVKITENWLNTGFATCIT
jgi:hypothetical protein